jgi:predicted DNA-binding ArsR family transcriptional regulator
MSGKILFLADIIEQKIRKEKELSFYEEELEKLKQKMEYLEKDILVTNIIIDAITNEKLQINGNMITLIEEEKNE